MRMWFHRLVKSCMSPEDLGCETHRKMHPREGFPAPATEDKSGRGYECLEKALRKHKAPRRRLSVRLVCKMGVGREVGSGGTYGCKVEIIKDAATCLPYRRTTIFLQTLLSIGMSD